MKVLWLAAHALLACHGIRRSPSQNHATLHVNRDAAQASHPELCASSIVRAQCDVLGTSFGQASAATVQSLFSASDESIQDYWQQLFGESSVLPAVGCQQLCDTTVSFLRTREQLPPASDTSCFDDGKEQRCLFLDVPTMESRLGLSGKQFPDVGDKKVLDEDALSQARAVDVSWEALLSNGSQPAAASSEVYNSTRTDTLAQLEYSVPDLAAKVARHFHIFTAQEATFEVVGGESSLLQLATPIPAERDLESGDVESGLTDSLAAPTSAERDLEAGDVEAFLAESSRTVQIRVNEHLQQARAYVTNAISTFSRTEAEPHIAAWFGPTGRFVRQEILRVLNSIDNVLSKVDFVYPGSRCDADTYAYVSPRTVPTDPSRRAQNSDGAHVFYLCDLFFEGEQVMTLLHEASHHAVGFTDDVCIDDLCGGDLACYHFVSRSNLPADVTVGELLRLTEEPHHIIRVAFVDDYVVKVEEVDPLRKKCRNQAYGAKSCRALAQVAPVKALRNADNVGYYITSVNGQHWGPWDPSTITKKDICDKPFPDTGDELPDEDFDRGSCDKLKKKTTSHDSQGPDRGRTFAGPWGWW